MIIFFMIVFYEIYQKLEKKNYTSLNNEKIDIND